jgi:hypothetical protein
MSENHPSEILIARSVAGKGSDEELRQLEEHARLCGRCRAEVDAARTARLHFDTQVFPRTLERIEERSMKRPQPWLRALSFGTVLAAAALVALFVRPVGRPRAGQDEPGETAKGTGALRLYARRAERVFPVEPGTILLPGDQVRFAVQSGSARFALIASIDGRGEASIYCPSSEIAKDAGLGWAFLGDSIVLDDSEGPERIFAVFSDERLDDEAVLPALRAEAKEGPGAIRGHRNLPLRWVQASVLFEKGTGEDR